VEALARRPLTLLPDARTLGQQGAGGVGIA